MDEQDEEQPESAAAGHGQPGGTGADTDTEMNEAAEGAQVGLPTCCLLCNAARVAGLFVACM